MTCSLIELTCGAAKEKEERKKRGEAMKKVHSLWADNDSDLVAVLKAIGAFEYSGGTEKFCEQKFLHYKVLLPLLVLTLMCIPVHG